VPRNKKQILCATTEGGGREEMQSCLNGYRVSVLRDGKTSGDWSHNNVNRLNTPELYT